MTPDGFCRIRGGGGLGDAIYLQSVVRHLLETGRHRFEVVNSWPDVFLPLKGKIRIEPFIRASIDIVAHYPSRRHLQDTSQFEDMCIVARIPDPVEMRLDWSVINTKLLEDLKEKAAGRPILWVGVVREPMGRSDKFGMDLVPTKQAYQDALDILKEKYFLLEVGRGPALYKLDGLHHSLMDKSSVTDLIDVATICDGFIGQCGYIIPLAESFHKKLMIVWSHKQATSSHPNGAPNNFIRNCNPLKILHRRDTSTWVMDSDSQARREAIVKGFFL